MREIGRTAWVWVLHSEHEGLCGFPATVVPSEDQPGNEEAENEEGSDASTDDGADANPA